MKQHLVVFTRFPEPGTTKTRLIPALGPEGAAQVHRELTQHTLACARQAAESGNLSLEVRFAGGDAERMASTFDPALAYRPQGEGDLGCRLQQALAQAFREGAQCIVVIGTDCPQITPQQIAEAFQRLTTCDVVLGPAADGGYYLIGLRRPAPQLFEGIAWGSATVLKQTLRQARTLGLDVSLLKTLSDVDRPEDLPLWHRLRGAGDTDTEPRLSVIIPTLNEAEQLPQTLACLRHAKNVEIIVVDGGSTDGTPQLAARAGCRLLITPPGRAGQLNAGARAATGGVLLFLHADTHLPAHFEREVRQALRVPGVVAGAFQLRIRSPLRTLRLIEWGVRLRAAWLQMPYGDQALFLSAPTFHQLGGFPALPILDDFELVRRLRRLGRIAIVPLPVSTSARRWESLGPWRTTWINQKVILGYFLGLSPDRLAQWYQLRQPGPAAFECHRRAV